MDLVRRAVTPLQIVLLLTFVVLVVFQTLSFPGMFAHMAREEPDVAHLRWPLTAFAAIEILCAQVVVVCTARLLTMVRQDRIFTEASWRWVDVIIGAVTTAWLLLAGLFLYVGAVADDPGVPMVLLFLLLVTGALGLLVPVMRGLLVQATCLRATVARVAPAASD